MNQPKYNVAILASGSGTNAENLVNYFRKSTDIAVSVIISNKSDAFVLQRAARLEVPSEVISGKQWQDISSVSQIFDKYRVDFLILAGYLLLIPSWVVAKYPGKIINVHPALLPKYGGKGMYGDFVHNAVIDAGDDKSGITIHLVNEHYDEGDIIFQKECPVFENDTPETLAQRIHQLEYQYFPEVVEKVIRNSNQ
jgi:phosphoribosylglycinamide formyltransferase 1